MTDSSMSVTEKQSMRHEDAIKTIGEPDHLEEPLPKNGTLTEEEEQFLASFSQEQGNRIFHKVRELFTEVKLKSPAD